jgi:hypothetical protein
LLSEWSLNIADEVRTVRSIFIRAKVKRSIPPNRKSRIAVDFSKRSLNYNSPRPMLSLFVMHGLANQFISKFTLYLGLHTAVNATAIKIIRPLRMS